MQTIKATITTAEGQRVRMTIQRSSRSQAEHHIDQVFPGNRSFQIAFVRKNSPVRLSC